MTATRRRFGWRAEPGCGATLATLAMLAGLAAGCDSGSDDGFRIRQQDGLLVARNGRATLEFTASPVGFRLLRDGVAVLASSPGDEAGEFAALSFSVAGGFAVPARAVADPDVPLSAGRLRLEDANGTVIGTLVVGPSDPDGFRLVLEPAAGVAPDAFGLAFDIASAGHWYGQGQLTEQKNAREGLRIPTSQNFPLDAGGYERPVLTSDEGTNVASPLWLTESGVALFADTYADLQVSFNRDGNERFRLHLLSRYGVDALALDLLTAPNTRDAYFAWVGRSWDARPDLPVGARPPDDVFTRPIWTTWAMYKSNISQEKVLAYARAVFEHGFDAGYIEIDDKWTPTWGDLAFDTARFPDPAGMIDAIHAMGAKVSAWIPPFVNRDAACFQEGVEAGAFVPRGDAPDPPDPDYPFLVGWWNSLFLPLAGAIDFSRPEAAAWWGARVDAVAGTTGLDGFKFDAGETQFLPNPAVLADGVLPNAYPDLYARWALAHRGVEVRAGWFAQDVPIAFRQFDKDTAWGLDNGLASVLTQALAMGLIGYPFVLPDMIGGNEYGGKADDELFIRWVQVNALMPMIQFSVVPWRDGFGPRVLEITKYYADLRAGFAAEFLRLADHAAATQEPILRPLFFVFPEDDAAYGIGDQFMLGDRYLVAPVLELGATTRDVYLPEGTWQALDDPEETHAGPVMLADYPAPLDRLPAFERLFPK